MYGFDVSLAPRLSLGFRRDESIAVLCDEQVTFQ